MKILIVDDDPGSRKLLRLLVESHGHGVIEASDGQEGLEKARAHKPDAIISDALMPGMDGFNFLNVLRHDDALDNIPFILYTAIYTGDEEYKLARSLGADALIVKPKPPGAFWEEFTSALEEHASSKGQAVKTRLDEKEEERFRDYCRLVAAKLEEKVRELEMVIADHERTKTSLLESEERYRLLFKNNPHPMWVYDLDTLVFLAVNEAAVYQYGYSREEFFSMTIKDIRPPEDVPALIDKVSKLYEGFDTARIWRHRKKDGSIIEVEISSHTLNFNGKRAKLVLAIDVTERRLLEQEIESAATEWRSTFDAMSDAILLMDLEGKIHRCNRAMADLVGKDFSEIIGRQCWEIVHGTLIPIEVCPRELMKKTCKKEAIVLQVGPRWFEVSVDPQFDSEGKLIGAVHIMTDITERKLAEKQLFLAKHEWEETFNTITDMVTVHDKDFNIIRANNAAKKILGLPFLDIKKVKCFDYFHGTGCPPEDCPGCLSLVTGKPYTSEMYEPHLKMFIEISAIPRIASNNQIVGLIHIVRDITERKKAEDILKEERNKAQNYLDVAGVMIVALDSGGRITLINKKGLEILGYEEPEVINQNWFDLCIPANVREEVQDKFNKLIDGDIGPMEYYENSIITKGGVERILAFHNAIIQDVSGEISGTLSSGEDVTERKRAKEVLERYSHELAVLNTASNTLMLITNLADIYQEVCNIIYTVFDLKMVWLGIIEEGSFEVKPVAYAGHEDGYLSSTRVTWDDSAIGMGPTGMAIKKHNTFKVNINDPIFMPWKLEAQKRGFVESVSVPLIYARDKCVGALNFYSDNPDYFTPDRMKLYQIFANQAAIAIENAQLVSGLEVEVSKRTRALEDTNRELQQLNKELYLRREEADVASRSKTDFLANMSHELRTPLNSIMGFADIIQQGMAGPVTERQKEFLNDISESGMHLLTLITDILDLSKIEAGKTVLEPETFPVKELIDVSLIMFKQKTLKHHIKVTAEIDDTITSITADKKKLKQVMVNLLSNAFKFTHDGGSVRVTARRVLRDSGFGIGVENLIPKTQQPTPDRDFVEISVSDTGIGISKENQQRLFQPFQQIETSLTRKYAGTGLGLSLCRRFVELHGGRIWVESEPGKGSRFVFIIPMKQSTANSE